MPHKPTRHKVFAYITHQAHLLIFSHPHAPEAGLQVPAGTLELGETPEAGVLREAFEETGLTNLSLVSFLGEKQVDMANFGRNEIHHRRFFHLRCNEQPPERWRHGELYPSDSTEEPIIFELWWVPLPHGVPSLIAGHDAFVPQLSPQMGLA
ncbi:MAG: NUDIX domain-containing protein [Chloroflexota bacterium]